MTFHLVCWRCREVLPWNLVCQKISTFWKLFSFRPVKAVSTLWTFDISFGVEVCAEKFSWKINSLQTFSCVLRKIREKTVLMNSNVFQPTIHQICVNSYLRNKLTLSLNILAKHNFPSRTYFCLFGLLLESMSSLVLIIFNEPTARCNSQVQLLGRT